MTSAVQIANLALGLIGDDNTLRDLADDTRAGRAIAAVFDPMRDACLRAHPWNFAKWRASLPAIDPPPAWGFASGFRLPADFIRFVEKEDVDRYQVESGIVLTNDGAPLNIAYIRRVTDTEAFDDLFVQALASRIANQVAMQLTGSATIKQAAWAEYQSALRDAKAVDGVENGPDELDEDYWITARESGY